MRTALIVVSMVLVIAVVAVVGLVAGFVPWLASEPIPIATSMPTPTPAPTPIPSPIPSRSADVKFDLTVTNVSGSGLSRTITAQVTNVGTADAHNVWGKLEAASQGSRVGLNGQDSIRVDIGTIAAGKTATTQVDLSFSITDGLKIAHNGVTFTLTIYSDEYVGTFTYNYRP